MSVDLTADQLTVTAGLDLLDSSGVLIDDISSDLISGTVKRDGFRTIHATCRLRVAKELQWTSQRLRPRITLDDGTNSESWYLGVFVCSTPAQPVGSSPAVFDVDGYDNLHILNTPLSAAYTADSGDAYLAEVETLFVTPGSLDVQLDQTSAASTLASDWSFGLDNRITYLSVGAELLNAVGYSVPYADRVGSIRSEPYLAVGSRPITHTMTSADVLSMVEESDTHDIPNVWVGINTDINQASLPTEGAGVYTVTNQSDGPTSVDSRGYTVTKLIRVSDADTQAALVATVDRIVAEDRLPSTVLRVTTGPLPSLWHRDAVRVNVPERGGAIRCESVAWELDLVSGVMTHDLRRAT